MWKLACQKISLHIMYHILSYQSSRYIAVHTVVDSRYIQNKILVVHIRPAKIEHLLQTLPIETGLYQD